MLRLHYCSPVVIGRRASRCSTAVANPILAIMLIFAASLHAILASGSGSSLHELGRPNNKAAWAEPQRMLQELGPTVANATDDSCRYARDGHCDVPTYCAEGTDCSDCGSCELSGLGLGHAAPLRPWQCDDNAAFAALSARVMESCCSPSAGAAVSGGGSFTVDMQRLPAGLVGYWPLDGSGAEQLGESGLDAVATNGEWVPGLHHLAFEFDGDDTLVVADPAGHFLQIDVHGVIPLEAVELDIGALVLLGPNVFDGTGDQLTDGTPATICAAEQQTCECNGSVKYGATSLGQWTPEVAVEGSILCSVGDAFADAVPGTVGECSCRANASLGGETSTLVDNVHTPEEWQNSPVGLVSSCAESLYVTIDLGGVHNVYGVRLWHYYGDTRAYCKRTRASLLFSIRRRFSETLPFVADFRWSKDCALDNRCIRW